jgi:hypothetical protein
VFGPVSLLCIYADHETRPFRQSRETANLQPVRRLHYEKKKKPYRPADTNGDAGTKKTPQIPLRGLLERMGKISQETMPHLATASAHSRFVQNM